MSQGPTGQPPRTPSRRNATTGSQLDAPHARYKAHRRIRTTLRPRQTRGPRPVRPRVRSASPPQDHKSSQRHDWFTVGRFRSSPHSSKLRPHDVEAVYRPEDLRRLDMARRKSPSAGCLTIKRHQLQDSAQRLIACDRCSGAAVLEAWVAPSKVSRPPKRVPRRPPQPNAKNQETSIPVNVCA